LRGPTRAAERDAPSSPSPAVQRKLLRDYAALSGGEFLAKLAGFLAFAYLARVLGPPAYGSVELAVALVTVFGLVVDFGLGPIGAREVTRRRQRAPELARLIPGARLALAVLAAAAMASCIAVTDRPRASQQLVWLFAVGLLAAPWSLNWLLQGVERMGPVAVAQPLRMLVFAAGVVLAVRGPDDLLRVGLAEVAAAAAMAAWFVVASRRFAVAPGLAFEGRALADLLREALPVGASQLLWALNHYVPMLLVASFAGDAELAFFGGANRIVMSLGTFVWLYFFNLYPRIVRATQGAAGSFARSAQTSFRITSWVGVMVLLLGALLAEPLCRLAYGAAFAAAALPLALLLGTLPIHLLSGHARFGLIGSGHQGKELAAQAGGLSVTLALGIPLVARFGSAGAALAALGSALAVWLLAHRLARQPIGRLPFAGPLLRPAIAAAAALGLFVGLPVASPWLRAALAALAYAALGALLEPRLRRDLRAALGAASDEPGSGASH
jgi:PST family polysaccharide transporter